MSSERGGELVARAQKAKEDIRKRQRAYRKKNDEDSNDVKVVTDFANEILGIIQTNANRGILLTEISVARNQEECLLNSVNRSSVSFTFHKLAHNEIFHKNIKIALRKELGYCNIEWKYNKYQSRCISGDILIIDLDDTCSCNIA